MKHSLYAKFSHNVFLVGVTNILTGLKSFVLLPILTKNLGISDYGIWEQIGVTISLLMSVALLGLPHALVRFLAGEESQEKQRDGFFSALTITGIVGSVFAVLLFVFSTELSAVFLGGRSAARFVQIAALLLVVRPLVRLGQAYFTALRQIAIRSFLLILAAIAEIGLVGGALLFGFGLQGAIVSLIAVSILILGVSLFIVKRQIGWSWPKFFDTRAYLAFGLPLILSSYFWSVANAGDRYVVGFFEGISAVGMYAAAYALGSLPYTVIQTPINVVLVPTITHLWEKKDIAGAQIYTGYALKYSLALMIPAAVGLSVLARPLLLIISTPDFVPAMLVVPFVAIGFVLLGIGVMGQYVLGLPKKTGTIMLIYASAAIINILLNMMLVPQFGILGAAAATTVTYLGFTIVMVYIAFRYMAFSLQFLFIAKSLTASAVMGLLIWGLDPGNLIEVVATAGSGAVVYFIILFGLKGLRLSEIRFFLSLMGFRA